MSARRRWLLLPAVAVLTLGAVVLALVRQPDDRPPQDLLDGLAAMPVAAAGRGLYFTAHDGTFTSAYGFAPGRVDTAVARAYGIDGEQITAVLESGGPSSTVLLGSFSVEDSAARFQQLGYHREQVDGWTVVTAGAAAAGPLAAGAEAVALRDDAVVIATAAEVAMLVAGDSALAAPWLQPLLGAVTGDASAVAMGPSDGQMAGQAASPSAPEGTSAPPTGWLVAFSGKGESRHGLVSLTFPEGAGPDAAGQLAADIRAAGGLSDSVALDPGAPRWDAARGLATVPVTATASAQGWQGLRRALETGKTGFLRSH